MSVAVNVAIGILIALLVGFEAGSLRRFALRRWRNVGSVVGVNRDEAEREKIKSFAQDVFLSLVEGLVSIDKLVKDNPEKMFVQKNSNHRGIKIQTIDDLDLKV